MTDLCDTCKHAQRFSGRRSFVYHGVYINQSGNSSTTCCAGPIKRLDMSDDGISYCSSYEKED